MTLTLALQLAIAGISVGSIYALVALAIVIPFKSSGVLNFGQGEIVTLGAYIALVLTQLALPYPVVVASILLLGAAGGVVIERVLIRPIVKAPEFTLVIATFAIGLLIKGVISIRCGDSPSTIDGLLGAPLIGINPEIGQLILRGLLAAVIGGFTSIPGALVGGLAVGLIETFSGVLIGSTFKNLVPFILLMVLLVFRPQGLFGAAEIKRV